jgi:cytochrome c1
MESPFWFYTKFLGLLAVVSVMIGYNFVRFGFHRQPPQPVWSLREGRAERGPELIRHYGCHACHVVPNMTATKATVGPRLDRLNDQVYLVGELANTPENFVLWVQHPRELRPQTAMPNLRVTDQDARDLAAFFYSAREQGRR